MAQDAARTAVGLHKAIVETVGLRDPKYSPKAAPGVQINITGDPKNVKAVEALLGRGDVEDAEEIEVEDEKTTLFVQMPFALGAGMILALIVDWLLERPWLKNRR
jgi:hypothetical protein